MIPARIRDKPQYVFHPRRLIRRALHGVQAGRPQGSELAVAPLPWGLPIEVNAQEAIGYTILTARVFDPCVTETLHRLIDPGDLVVDVGANVGYLTSLAAARAGADGRVISYEPHPAVFGMLSANVARWREHSEVASVDARQAAVSDHEGTAELSSGPLFHVNMGLAALADADAPAGTNGANRIRVDVHTLDDVLGETPVGLLKIDVEGHEPEVLAGARHLLERGLIRDIVFEDHDPYPDASTKLVEDAGYHLVSLENDLFGLCLVAPAERKPPSPWPGPSYLATRDPERALSRLGGRGWQVDGIGPSLPWRRSQHS